MVGHKSATDLTARLCMQSQLVALLVVQTLETHLGSQVRAGRSDHVVFKRKQVLKQTFFLCSKAIFGDRKCCSGKWTRQSYEKRN